LEGQELGHDAAPDEAADDQTGPTPQAIRLLLHRKVLAAQRHRAAVARLLGISTSEVTALAYLAQGGMTPGQLGDRLQLTSGGVTALLHRLERGGHVKRRPHPRDKRSVVLIVSREILEQVANCYAPLVADQDAITGQLSDADRAVLAAYLARIAALSERQVDDMVARLEQESAEVPDNDAMHLWA
jgi:DNA-binding MarR family transcriptional regulator